MTQESHESGKSLGSNWESSKELEGVEYEFTSSRRIRRAKVTLDFDFEHDGVPYTQLIFGRMKTKYTYSGEDEENETKAGLMIYALMGNVSIDVIGEVDAEDLERITEAVLPLMGKSASQIAKKEMERLKTQSR